MDFVPNRVETDALNRRDATQRCGCVCTKLSRFDIDTLRGKAIFRRGYTTIALTLLPREALVEEGAPPSAGVPSPSPALPYPPAHRRGTQPACTTAGWLKASTARYLADKQILMSKTVRPNCIMAFPRILRASNLSVPPPGNLPLSPPHVYIPP